jgi:hypothetical protein
MMRSFVTIAGLLQWRLITLGIFKTKLDLPVLLVPISLLAWTRISITIIATAIWTLLIVTIVTSAIKGPTYYVATLFFDLILSCLALILIGFITALIDFIIMIILSILVVISFELTPTLLATSISQATSTSFLAVFVAQISVKTINFSSIKAPPIRPVRFLVILAILAILTSNPLKIVVFEIFVIVLSWSFTQYHFSVIF